MTTHSHASLSFHLCLTNIAFIIFYSLEILNFCQTLKLNKLFCLVDITRKRIWVLLFPTILNDQTISLYLGISKQFSFEGGFECVTATATNILESILTKRCTQVLWRKLLIDFVIAWV